MYNLKRYYDNVIKYNLLNKFEYQDLKRLPKIKKVVLNFNCKAFEIKKLSTALLALKLVTNKKGKLTTSNKPNIILKIKKGTPVGCKVILTSKLMYKFLNLFIFRVLPTLKNSALIKIKDKSTITYTIKNSLIFKILEKNYIIFNNIQNVNINIITTTASYKELFFLLKSFKLKNLTLK